MDDIRLLLTEHLIQIGHHMIGGPVFLKVIRFLPPSFSLVAPHGQLGLTPLSDFTPTELVACLAPHPFSRMLWQSQLPLFMT